MVISSFKRVLKNKKMVQVNMVLRPRDYFLPKESGIEIEGHSFICADGAMESSFYKTRSCLDKGGVSGVQIELVPWPEATPGLKILKFDHQNIPFFLDVIGLRRLLQSKIRRLR